MIDVAALRAVPLFAELSDDDLHNLAANVAIVTLEPDEELFAEGDKGDVAYVITRGHVEITKRSGDRDVHLATRGPGEVIGEMALLQDSLRSASARASDGAELIAVPRTEIDELLATSAEAVRALFRVLLERWQSTQVLLAQSERMAQLGTLTAGLAHELNNPAAAVSRSAGQLREAIGRRAAAEASLAAAVGDADRMEALRALLHREPSAEPLDAIDRADLEATVEARLDSAGVAEAWNLAAAVVEAGLGPVVDEIVQDAGPHADRFLAVLLADRDVASLLHTVEEGTRRLSAIVRALKSYSYLDQGPVQQVDLIAGLEDTLLILGSKLDKIEVRQEYHPDVPNLEARGGELNQVWTNLIDNAADAIRASEDGGTITIRAYPSDDTVTVEVEDDGTGIAPEHRERIFDSFFTTKPPGAGTGLGLSITWGIVVDSHHGDIAVESEPGHTVFRVVLPLRVSG